MASNQPSASGLWRDKQWGAALLAAPLFWGLWWLITQPAADLTWPAREPVNFLLPALVYPLLEELVFRGLIQHTLYQYAWGARRLGTLSVANLITSVLFGLAHLWRQPLAWAAAVIAPSLLFGYFRDRYHSVVPAIVLHTVYNTGFFWLFRPGI